ncbi:uncharacterized protein LOC120935844 isoform X1 [Rana temporaria]|uniref:uncharacterized protein LOC120935844 isoform X1 n=1 Tax=Rana temporaria TaxID=8407 RepID=UPI001AADCDF2|nr:uncharacterized protein LOC120935844 isoform X1 [Rana temporaria]XP_040203832.1 uncharacterized protein LOC120935844 isoform X1 [Rana temporaria]XP_040203833.1 uncharacterized protein LOC120935844 isoform X1 [Rana temporaria]
MRQTPQVRQSFSWWLRTKNLQERKINSPSHLEGDVYRCQSKGLGSGVRRSFSPGNLGQDRKEPAHQYTGDEGSILSPQNLDTQVTGPPGADSIRQCYCSSLHQSPGRHPQLRHPERGESAFAMGRTCSLSLCNLHSGGRKLASGLSESPATTTRRVVSPTRYVSGHVPEMGTPGCRPASFQVQQEVGQLCVQDERSSGLRIGCSNNSAESVFTDLCISANRSLTKATLQDQEGKNSSNPSSPKLAQKALVHRNHKDGSGKTLEASASSRPDVARSSVPSFLTKAKFDGLATETHILKKQGISGPVLSTLINASICQCCRSNLLILFAIFR